MSRLRDNSSKAQGQARRTYSSQDLKEAATDGDLRVMHGDVRGIQLQWTTLGGYTAATRNGSALNLVGRGVRSSQVPPPTHTHTLIP